MPNAFPDIIKFISLFFVFIAPFFVIYAISRRFESAEREKKRFSGIFLAALTLTFIYGVMFNIWSWCGLWGRYPFFGNEIMGIGAFLIYLFFLHMRERFTGEDPWDRLFRFTAPYLMFYLIYCVTTMHTIYLGRLLQGTESFSLLETVWTNPIFYAFNNFGFPFAFYFIFLSYVECGNILKRFGIEHRPILISAVLILVSFLI